MRPLSSPRRLAEDAADTIRAEILSGRLKQGERLVEATLAEQLKVSRGPVREALKILGVEGLVHDEPRRGAFVVSLDSADVREIYDLRAALEGRAARLVTLAAKPEDLRVIRRVFDDMRPHAATGDVAAFARADLKFHETVCLRCGNRRLHTVFMRYVPLLYSLIRLDEYLYTSLDLVAEDHVPMIEAIEAGDGDSAAHLFESHADRARDLVVAYIDEHGHLDPNSASAVERPGLASQAR